jgi:hypothetical protein
MQVACVIALLALIPLQIALLVLQTTTIIQRVHVSLNSWFIFFIFF